MIILKAKKCVWRAVWQPVAVHLAHLSILVYAIYLLRCSTEIVMHVLIGVKRSMKSMSAEAKCVCARKETGAGQPSDVTDCPWLAITLSDLDGSCINKSGSAGLYNSEPASG